MRMTCRRCMYNRVCPRVSHRFKCSEGSTFILGSVVCMLVLSVRTQPSMGRRAFHMFPNSSHRLKEPMNPTQSETPDYKYTSRSQTNTQNDKGIEPRRCIATQTQMHCNTKVVSMKTTFVTGSMGDKRCGSASDRVDDVTKVCFLTAQPLNRAERAL